jgi:Xaa-Pro aminopeptidase
LQVSIKIEEWLPDFICNLGLKKLGFEANDISFSVHRRLSDALAACAPRLDLVPLEGVIESLRAIKETSEVDFIKQAAAISDAAIDYVKENLEAGKTEIEIACKLEQLLRWNGSQPIPFDVIVASGPNAALPHARPSSRLIKNGEPVIIDLGAAVEGYVSDISRTICLGEANDTFKKLYGIVLEAQQAATDGIREGISAIQADKMARRVIKQAGYEKEFGHSLGHGLGLSVHEKPYISSMSKDKLRNNMVFTIEPGIYIPNWGGIRIEDTVMLKNGKIELLSKSKK